MDLSFILNVLFVAGAVAIGVGSTLVLRMKKDNPIEQAAESIIKDKTGQDIDLSPEDK